MGYGRRRIVPTPTNATPILLLPTATYNVCSDGCDLRRVAKALTHKSNGLFDFRAFGDWAGTGKFARVSGAPIIAKRWPLRNSFSIEENAMRSNAEQVAAVETYISIEDAVEQVQEFVKRNNLLSAAFGRSLDDAIIIAIGSETVVAEDGENEFLGDISLDAYSALCLPVEEKGSDGFLEIGSNESLTAGEKVCFVSLRRLALVFPEIVFTDKPVRARSIAARYITSNTMAFVLGCLFTESLSHHNATGCINETAWTGGERDSYFAEGVCHFCAQHFSEKCHPLQPLWNAENILSCVSDCLSTSRRFDEMVSGDERFSYWIQFAATTIAIQLICAWIFATVFGNDFDIKLVHLASGKDGILIPFHWLTAAVVAVALAATAALAYRRWHVKKSIP